MKRIYKSTYGLVALIIVALLSGCLGGGSSTSKTYELTVIVVDDPAGTPLEGVIVEVIGKGLEAKETNAFGQVSFSGLSGTVEVLVQSTGYRNKSQSVVMNKEQSITIRLLVDGETTVVEDEAGLKDALSNPEVTELSLAKDVVLSTKLIIERPINLNLNGKNITGDVEFNFAGEEQLELTGTGQIAGNLSINAPNSSVTNRVHVTGEVSIVDVASETWHEYAHNNRLVIRGSDLRVHVYHGAESIEISEGIWGIHVHIHQDLVSDFTANSSVSVVGADKISNASINAEGVVFDYSPGKVSGAVEPEILNPDPYDPELIQISGPRFATVSKKVGRFFNFELGEASSEEGDLKLTWVQYGNQYAMIGFENYNGVRFSVDNNLYYDNIELLFEHFRTVTATDWTSSEPGEIMRLNTYDTVLLKTNSNRLVKLFILEMRGHENHDDAAAVDFVYLFLDEVDYTPPIIESVTLVTESREITKPVQGGIIEFEIEEDPEEIYYTFNEVVYENRPLARHNVGSPFTSKTWFSARYIHYLSSPLSKEFSTGISVYGMDPPWSIIELTAGDSAFYADFDDDQGYFFSDLFGNQLTELPFEKIVIKRIDTN